MAASLAIGILVAPLTARSAAGDPHEYAGQPVLLAEGGSVFPSGRGSSPDRFPTMMRPPTRRAGTGSRPCGNHR